MHDWGDEACIVILSNLREAMLSAPRDTAGRGLVVVLEQVVGGIREGHRPGACNASGHGGLYLGGGRGGGSGSRTVIYDRMAAAMDISMLCMVAEGRERSESEFRSIFASAGFRLVHAAPTKSPMALMLLEPCEHHHYRQQQQH